MFLHYFFFQFLFQIAFQSIAQLPENNAGRCARTNAIEWRRKGFSFESTGRFDFDLHTRLSIRIVVPCKVRASHSTATFTAPRLKWVALRFWATSNSSVKREKHFFKKEALSICQHWLFESTSTSRHPFCSAPFLVESRFDTLFSTPRPTRFDQTRRPSNSSQNRRFV